MGIPWSIVVAMCVVLAPVQWSGLTWGQEEQLCSPNERLCVRIKHNERLSYTVTYDGNQIMGAASLSLTLATQQRLGESPVVIGRERRTVDREVRPVVAEKNAVIRDHFNELQLACEGGYRVDFRAFDTGVAYRFATAMPGTMTVVLAAQVGEVVALARCRQGQWYLGAMTDEHARQLELVLGFLPEGDYDATIWQDGRNADRWASDLRVRHETIRAGQHLKVTLAPGGGWVARLLPVSPDHR